MQIVVNNGMYGTIRMHQERRYPGGVSGTDIGGDADYAALARAMGGNGETVADDGAFPAAFERALEAAGPALIEVRVSPKALTPSMTLSDIRAKALGQHIQS